MAQCSNCGFELDDRRALPPSCPRCGAATGVGAPPPFGPSSGSPGAPPDYQWNPENVSGTTLFGVPQVGEGDHGSGPPGIDVGPPAIAMDGEIDLPGLPAGQRSGRAAPTKLPPRTGTMPHTGNVPPSTPLPGKRVAPPNVPAPGRSSAAPPNVPSPPRAPGAPPRVPAAAPRPPAAPSTFSAPRPAGAPAPRPTAPPSFSSPSPTPTAAPQRTSPTPPASFSSPARTPATFNPPAAPRGMVPGTIPRPPGGVAFDSGIDNLPSPVRARGDRPRPVPGQQQHGEVDLGDEDNLLELDLPSHRPTPLPGELDLPTSTNTTPRPDLGGVDLPVPVASRPAAPRLPPRAPSRTPLPGALDLLAPAPRRGPGPKAPPPPPAHGQSFAAPGLDLPAPSQLDLPTPSARRGLTPPPHELDLPPPASFAPTPIGLDLPEPSDMDLPQPIGLDLEPVNNMLQPISLDLEPQASNYLQPAELGIQPAELNVQPAELGVEPANLGLEPANLGLAPIARARGTADLHGDEAKRREGPRVREIGQQGVSRGLLYGGAAILLIGALGAGLLYVGVFDPNVEDPQPRGIGKAEAQKGRIFDEAGLPVAPVAERSDEILAKLRADTPVAYHEAVEAAKAAGDRLGYAEALLLLSFRYGPDETLVADASKQIEPYAKATDPVVTRVFGLLALAKGEDATKLLGGTTPREHLYRGWMYLAQDKPDEAITAATAMLATDKASVAALHLQHAAGIAKNAGTELPLLEQAATAHPDHPGLQELRLRAGIQLGRLATATDALAKIKAPDDAPAAFRARRATLEGLLAAARGDLLGATAKYDAALALVPKNVEARIGKIRALIASQNVQAMLPEMKALAQERPHDATVALLGVEAAIAAGDGEAAIAKLDELDKTMPDRVELAYFRGQVAAMRAQIDEAKAAFAKALAKDPNFWAASLAEAHMLGQARMVTEAVAVLDTALRRANEASAEGPVQARLLHAKADLLAKQGQSTAALTALDSAIDVDPSNNDAQVLRGRLRLDAADHEGGRADLVAVYERTGGYPGLAGPLGHIFVSEGKVDDAAKLIGDAAGDERAPVDLKLVAARIELARNNSEGAKTQLSHVLAQDGSNWEAHLLMAQAFLAAADHAEALARINQAQPPKPSAELHLLKGKILEFNGKYVEARPEYLKALKIDPAQHEARFLYGRSLAAEGVAKQAEAELAQVVEATGDRFPEAWLNLGRAQRDLGENDDALTSLAKSTALDPTLQEGFYLEGRIHADRNKHARAIELFQKATAGEDRPTFAWWVDALAALGRAQAKAGQGAAAKAAFTKFLEVAPADHASRADAERQVKAL